MMEADSEGDYVLYDEAQALVDALREALHYTKCPTCSDTGMMPVGRPNGDDRFQVDGRYFAGRHGAPMGGGMSGLRMGVEPCTTCEARNRLLGGRRREFKI